MSNNVFELTLKNDKRVIPEIAAFLSDSAYKLGLSKKKAYFLCFTIETFLELRTDQISDANPEIKIVVSDNGTYFKFSLTDLGEPYILTANQQKVLSKKLVDRYSFEQLGRKGQCFSFIFNYDHKENPELTIHEEEKLLDEEFSYRILTGEDEDILKAVKCLYAVYGYDYYHQNLYSVEAFKKYMANGRYVPIIAENKHKQVMGYCALDESEWFMGLPELSSLSTKPIARGKGLAQTIFKQTEDIAKSLNYEGINVSAVAYHPYTQKMCNKLNYTPSAVEYEINPKGTGGYDKDRRLDCVIGVKIFNKSRKHNLYLKEECNELISSIFDQEELNYEIINSKDYLNCESEITYGVDVDTDNCFGKIDICGDDIEKQINDIVNKEEVKACDVITFNLNVNHPNATKGYQALKDLGFICVGIIPGCLNGDFLLLQSFKVKPEYEKIVVEDNYKELIKKVYKLNRIGDENGK